MTAIAAEFEAPRLPRLVREHWRAAVVAAVMLVLFGATIAGIALRDPAVDVAIEQAETGPIREMREAADTTTATQLRPVAPTDALALNAAIPVSNAANPAARAFTLAGANEANRARSLDCLTAAIYYEAARETTDGQRAVAQVVLNRVRHPAYPASVCGVVFEGARRYTGCQFSFSCDGSLRRAPMAVYWERARTVAQAALNGYVYVPVGWATHYHANYVVPYWASSLVKSATIGTHIFYRWRGGWGRPPAFLNRYTGIEPAIAWRGGFGQPLTGPGLANDLSGRDAAAADAAQAAAGDHSVDSFQRAVLRRYEPLRRDSANAVIQERMRANPSNPVNVTESGRWALTGETAPERPAQRPLGRWSTAPAEPAPLAPPRVTPPAPAPAQSSNTEAPPAN